MRSTLLSAPWRSEKIRRAFVLILVLVLAWSAVIALLYVAYLAGFPYQLDDMEGAHLCTTLALVAGHNPWAPRYAPQDFNCYGVLFAWIAGHLLPADHRDIQALRGLNLAALGLAALLVGGTAARLARSALAGAAAGLAALGGYLFFVTPTVGCDAFAALLFIAPLALAGLGKSRRVLAGAVALAALGFFAKPYAAVAGPAICLLLAGQGRWRASFAVGLAWAVLLAALAVGAELAWPGYLESTTLLQAKGVTYSFPYMIHQSEYYLRAAGFPLLLLAAVAVFRFRVSRVTLAWTLPALAMLALLVLWLGWNSGAFLEYYFQLLHPTALLAVSALWGGRPAGERWLEAGLVYCAVLSVGVGTCVMGRFVSMDYYAWHEAEGMVAAARLPLVPPLLTSVATVFGKPISDNGSTRALALEGAALSGPALRRAFQQWQSVWNRRLLEHRVDLVFSSEASPVAPALLKGYVRLKRICLPETVAVSDAYIQCYDVYGLKSSGYPALSKSPAAGR